MLGNLFAIKRKRDVMYDAAMSAANSIVSLIKLGSEGSSDLEIDKSAFHRIYSNDPNSPTIHFLSKDEYIIYYPPYSTKYSNGFKEKCKFVEVLKGIIYDQTSGRKVFKGDKVKVSPSDNYVPYTLEKEAYVRVCVGDCESIWDQVCQ